ncbi:MAG: leucine-rich repeat domain-containing protein [Treponema sp.]|nr:leucine-rich repeat domain-containing protein [Treponema sp.]
MANKKKQLIKGLVFILSVIFVLSSCSKQGSKKQTQTAKEIKGITVNDNKALSSYMREANKAFKRAKEAPASDFIYGLTDLGDGVVIKKYNKKKSDGDVEIIIPSEIEGMPVVELADDAFHRSIVKTVVIPDSILRIGKRLFLYSVQLKYVKLLAQITSLPEDIFENCESLEYFDIPSHITNIESGAFFNSGLRAIEIPETVTFKSFRYDGEDINSMSVLGYCKNLEYVSLPNTMTILPYSFFKGCASLKNIKLPASIEIIEDSVFEKCTSLEYVDLPASLVSIGNAFEECGIKSLIIPDSVTDCNKLQLSTCKQLESLTLPNNMTEIKNSLLQSYSGSQRCSNLKSINFPKSLTKIEYEAFYMLSSLGEIIIPENLTSVEFKTNDFGDTRAFRGTSLPLRTQAKLKQLGYTGKFTL